MGRFQRAVGVIVFGTALLAAALVGWVVAVSGDPTPRTLTTGLLVAAGSALLVAAAVGWIERRIATRARRSLDPRHLPLAPKVVMAETRGVYAGPVTVTALIPAHNEEACLAATLESLLSQSHRPRRVIVIADNCTDGTVEIARRAGVDVIETVDNRLKKAGALNQALRQVLPGLGDNDLVLVMDADTTLDDGFLEGVVRRATADRGLMAVGGLFYGEEGSGLLGQFQRNEYTRYGRDLRRRRGRLFVLTGTASLFRPRALRAVADARGRSLPGVPGDVYDTAVLTEDNELTLALKSLGALTISPAECTVVTEVMPTWQALWAQRLRWQRGALENLAAYGLRPATFRYWVQQLGIGYGVIALATYLGLLAVMALYRDTWAWFPFWLGVGALFTVERVVSVWAGGWRARLLGVLLIPELCYALFLDVVYLKGVWDISLRRQAHWKHVVVTDRGAVLGS